MFGVCDDTQSIKEGCDDRFLDTCLEGNCGRYEDDILDFKQS